MTINTEKLDPRKWSKRNKIIAAAIVAILVLASIAAGVLHSQFQHDKDAKNCVAYQEVVANKKTQLDQSIKAAQDALATVDASLKPGEGTRLEHTDGFPLSTEGQSAIRDLSKAIDTAKSAKDTDATPADGKCPNAKQNQNNTGIDQAIKAIDDQTKSFIETRDAYRLTKATDEANTLMDEAKSKLATAQQNASEQIAAVEADPSMESDATVKATYEALKAVETESHSLSNTVTVTTYDEAVASIEKAKAINAKADEVETSQATLKDAVTAYQAAKAGSAAPAPSDNAGTDQGSGSASAPSYSSGSNPGNSNNGSSYSGGSSYTPPAYNPPAPAPAPPANNSGSGSSDGRIDFGPGQADRPGCVVIEGRTVC
jgi:hypothetical protein